MASNDDIEYPKDDVVIKRIRYEKWCPKCEKNTLRSPTDIPRSKFGQTDPESFKATMEDYLCSECHTCFRLPKVD